MKQPLSSQMSCKLTFFSFFGIVLVVMIHSTLLDVGGDRGLEKLMKFFSFYVGSLFKPLFFTISGFLFFWGTEHPKEFVSKITKRFRTLVIPFLLTNFLTYCLLGALKHIPSIAAAVNARFYLGCAEHHTLGQWFYLMWVKPYMFHLWFLKTLFCVILLAPLLYLFLRKKKSGAVGLAFLLLGVFLMPWLNRFGWYLRLSEITPNLPYALFCFASGGYFALHNIFFAEEHSRKTVWILLAGSIVSGLLLIAYTGNVWGIWYFPLFLTCWAAYDLGIGKKIAAMKWLSYFLPYSFFIYLFHMPWMNVGKKLLVRLPFGGAKYYIAYFLSPLLIIVLLGMIGRCVDKYLPRVYQLLTGGRGLKRQNKFNGR